MALAVNLVQNNKKCKTKNGYNPYMFLENQKFLENYQCAICKWIVKDCVEVSCMSDGAHEDDINSLNYNPIWCLNCLQTYLNKNKQICPINGRKHDKNAAIKAVPTSYIRRQVSRAQIRCLNGHDHHRSNQDGKDDIDEYEIDGLQLEGRENTKQQENNNGCQWQGMLCNYDKHVEDECGYIEVECPLNEHFHCCDNNYNHSNNNNDDNKIFKCHLSSMMKNDVNYLSKHFKICFDNYLNLKEKYGYIEEKNKKLMQEKETSSNYTKQIKLLQSQLREKNDKLEKAQANGLLLVEKMKQVAINEAEKIKQLEEIQEYKRKIVYLELEAQYFEGLAIKDRLSNHDQEYYEKQIGKNVALINDLSNTNDRYKNRLRIIVK